MFYISIDVFLTDCTEVVKVLIENGAGVNDTNIDGLAPLHIATRFGVTFQR